ncbi:hypothetical protein G9A89_020207 [Geosiphon pyriformis]|nr:hypothetical protein G9A89_020207 [Geosiphon pyriformis]
MKQKSIQTKEQPCESRNSKWPRQSVLHHSASKKNDFEQSSKLTFETDVKCETEESRGESEGKSQKEFQEKSQVRSKNDSEQSQESEEESPDESTKGSFNPPLANQSENQASHDPDSFLQAQRRPLTERNLYALTQIFESSNDKHEEIKLYCEYQVRRHNEKSTRKSKRVLGCNSVIIPKELKKKPKLTSRYQSINKKDKCIRNTMRNLSFSPFSKKVRRKKSDENLKSGSLISRKHGRLRRSSTKFHRKSTFGRRNEDPSSKDEHSDQKDSFLVNSIDRYSRKPRITTKSAKNISQSSCLKRKDSGGGCSGIFSKGKTSSQVPTRGVPDLSFVEIKFPPKREHDSSDQGASVQSHTLKAKKANSFTKEKGKKLYSHEGACSLEKSKNTEQEGSEECDANISITTDKGGTPTSVDGSKSPSGLVKTESIIDSSKEVTQEVENSISELSSDLDKAISMMDNLENEVSRGINKENTKLSPNLDNVVLMMDNLENEVSKGIEKESSKISPNLDNVILMMDNLENGEIYQEIDNAGFEFSCNLDPATLMETWENGMVSQYIENGSFKSSLDLDKAISLFDQLEGREMFPNSNNITADQDFQNITCWSLDELSSQSPEYFQDDDEFDEDTYLDQETNRVDDFNESYYNDMPFKEQNFNIQGDMSFYQYEEADEEDLEPTEVQMVVDNSYSVDDDLIEDDPSAVQQLQLQQQYAAQAQIPDVVKNFIVYFHRNILENNVYELHGIYENSFNRLTEKYYEKQPWPKADFIAPLVNDDQVFLTLYRELYYRHIYSKLTPTIEHRFHSYENYCDLFNYILNSDGPVALELPNQWLWDIIDEFIYQFQSFCNYRNRLKNKSDEEISLLRENVQVWSCYSVLNVLYSLITKSKITEQLLVTKNGGDMIEAAGEYGSRALYKMLGYFSIIGLLRVHCLLGDYTLALKMMDNIELNKKALFARVTACHVTTYYYVGFSYMMMRRYADAIKAFSHVLVFIARTKMYHTRSYQFDEINKKGDQMYALLAICISLCPTRLDENIHSYLREKYGDHLTKIQRGEEGISVFEDLFFYACPKFISPIGPNFEDLNSLNQSIEPQHHHAKIFISEVRHQILIPTLRSYLKLYTTMGIDKLATFLEIDPEELRTQLLIFKQKSRQQKWSNGTLLEGEYVTTSDLDFCLKKDMIHIAESKIGRRYGDWFLRNINKFQDIIAGLELRN